MGGARVVQEVDEEAVGQGQPPASSPPAGCLGAALTCSKGKNRGAKEGRRGLGERRKESVGGFV